MSTLYIRIYFLQIPVRNQSRNPISLLEKERKQKEILDIVAGDTKLRSKRELIERFIEENLPLLDEANIEEGYHLYDYRATESL